MKSPFRRTSLRIAWVSCAVWFVQAPVQAGPFSDWWLNQQPRPVYPVTPSPPVTTVNAGYGTYGYNAYTGYPNTSYSPILPLSLPQTNVGWLPTGAYASQYYKAPTTYYRPVTAFDPTLGTTVTSLQPCASYQYQAQRVPLLTPSWQNYAYGGYGSAAPQNRWSPVTPPTYQPNLAAPAVGSAAGQSGLSIASGFGTYGSAPVVQPPANYSYAPNYPSTVVGVAPTGSLPLATAGSSPIVSGYGGIHYGQPQSSTTVLGSSVVPAASWVQSGTTITPIGPTYTTPAAIPTTTSTYPPMPGSMGLPTVPSAVSPTVTAPSFTAPSNAYGSTTSGTPSSTIVPAGTSVFPPVLPHDPATSNLLPSATAPTGSTLTPGTSTIVPSTQTLPTNSGSGIFDRESTIVPSLNLSESTVAKPSTLSSDTPRFQLRGVEQAPSTSNSLNSAVDASPSPWSRNEALKPEAPKALDLKAAPENSNENLKLDLNTDALKPIPAPNGFDAAPEWKPSLLNARDQTARHSEVKPVVLEGEVHSIRPVHYLQSLRPVGPAATTTTTQPDSLGVRIELRPVK